MIFLNPLWLFALPLILLPIVIHLLNQRRHRTVQWGAMQFLLSAKRMSRGMARLKQWLIMAARMMVIAGLILAIGRPLSSGWVGSLTGGQPETVIVLLDRSASMQQQQIATGETKLSTGISKIAAALQTVGREKPIVLFDSCSPEPVQVDRPADLLDLPNAAPTDASTNLPELMQWALEYISDNQTGRTDVWICSDAAANDWNPETSRWQSLNSGFSKLEGVRFQLLNFPTPPVDNLSVVVDRFERVDPTDPSHSAELVLDLTIQRESSDTSVISVPLTFTINGLRSVLNVELAGTVATLVGHRIPIDGELAVGWGSVELPIDSFPSDNAYYFSYADPPVRQTVIVSENSGANERATRAIELAVATSIQPGTEYASNTIRPDQVAEIDWQATALLIWQAALPDESVARQLESFIDSGRTAIFLPPQESDNGTFVGVKWDHWKTMEGTGLSIGYWNNDDDLLARTRNGDPLPVNDLRVYRYRQPISENAQRTELAKLENGASLLTRIRKNGGAIYFLSTWPVATHSSLDREGITLFAMLHRAIDEGAESLGAAKQFDAGTSPAMAVAERPALATNENRRGSDGLSAAPILSQDRPFQAGVYGDADSMIALNRPVAEDRLKSLSKAELDELFKGLDYQVIEDSVGSQQSLASEIWRAFIALMGIALLAEAFLCLPPKTVPKTESLAATPSTKVAA